MCPIGAHACRCSLRATVEAGIAAGAGHAHPAVAARDDNLSAGDTIRAGTVHCSGKLARRLLAAAAAGSAPMPEDSLQRLTAAADWQWLPRRRPAVKRSRIARAPTVRSVRAALGTLQPHYPANTVMMCRN